MMSEHTNSKNLPNHVGIYIKSKFRELYPDKTMKWFAEQMGCGERNLQKILQKKMLRISQIQKFSVAIEYNFFGDFCSDNLEDVADLTLDEIELYLAGQISKAFTDYKAKHPGFTLKELAEEINMGYRTAERMFECAKVDSHTLSLLSNKLNVDLFTPIASLLQRHLDEKHAFGSVRRECRDKSGFDFTEVQFSPDTGFMWPDVSELLCLRNSDEITLYSADGSRSQEFDIRSLRALAHITNSQLRNE